MLVATRVPSPLTLSSHLWLHRTSSPGGQGSRRRSSLSCSSERFARREPWTSSRCASRPDAGWHVRCDVHVLDACGNIAGAASLAADAPAVVPKARGDGQPRYPAHHSPPRDVGTRASRTPSPPRRDHLRYFAEQDGLVIADPTVNEEMVIGSELVVVLKRYRALRGALRR